MENIVEKYEWLRSEYQKIIVDSFNKNDFQEYTENLFTAHSCGIEGNSFTVNDTRELREKGLSLKIFNKSLFEAFEILDHFNAYEFAMENLDRELSESFVKQIHSILTKNTLNFKTGSTPGEYTDTDMGAGDTIFGDHVKNIEMVPKLLSQTEDAIKRKLDHPLAISAKFHKHFIYLHPFRDGNGRVGRLLSNFILARQGHPLVIIEQENKNAYIDALKASHKHRDNSPIVSYFFETSIKRMSQEIEQKKNLTENFFLRFSDGEEENFKRKLKR